MLEKLKLLRLKIHWPLLIFIAGYLIFSFATYKNYGITGDEGAAYRYGKILLNHFSKPTTPETFNYNNYATDSARQMPLFSDKDRIYPMLLTMLNQKGYYEWFHLLNLLFGLTIFITSYILLYSLYKKNYYAILGPILLAITPRFFGDIPANPKDMPFAVVYFLSLALIYFFNKQTQTNTKDSIEKTLVKILILGIVFGFTQALRPIGFSIYLVFLGFELLTHHINKKLFLETFVIFIIASFTMIITWPYLGINFFQNLPALLSSAQSFEPWDNAIMYLGKFITKDQRPWHYLFVWILVTTPLSILFSFFGSLGLIKKFKQNIIYTLLFLALIINLGFYLILKPVIYNGPRHFLFLLPIITLMGTIGLIEFIKNYGKKTFAKTILTIFAIYLIFTGYKMLQLHPYEYVYFNEITNPQDNFELDYWGASYKEATDWLIKYFDENKLINQKVYVCNVSFAVQYYAKGTFELVNSGVEADFIICDYNNLQQRGYRGQEIKRIERDNNIFNVILKAQL